jgi:hypothetical protein
MRLPLIIVRGQFRHTLFADNRTEALAKCQVIQQKVFVKPLTAL